MFRQLPLNKNDFLKHVSLVLRAGILTRDIFFSRHILLGSPLGPVVGSGGQVGGPGQHEVRSRRFDRSPHHRKASPPSARQDVAVVRQPACRQLGKDSREPHSPQNDLLLICFSRRPTSRLKLCHHPCDWLYFCRSWWLAAWCLDIYSEGMIVTKNILEPSRGFGSVCAGGRWDLLNGH